MGEIFQIITTIRNMRLELEIPLKADNIKVKVCTADVSLYRAINEASGYIKNLCRLDTFNVESEYRKGEGEFVNVLRGVHLVIPLQGVVDIERHKRKTGEKIQKIEAEIRVKEDTLLNRDFLKRAPEQIVQGEKEKLMALKEELIKLKGVRDGLG
jgi:valyl-tRNA synthetase